MIEAATKIVITGAAGLVGQNLIISLKEAGYTQITALDKSVVNLGILRQLHPDVTALQVDLSERGDWMVHLQHRALLPSPKQRFLVPAPSTSCRPSNMEQTRPE